MAFRRFLPEEDAIYQVVSDNLLPSRYQGIWVNEQSEAVLFSCLCGVAEHDLRSEDLMGRYYPKISTPLKNGAGYYPTRPWTIQCDTCGSIYNICNGWDEPNNGRMVTVLNAIFQIKKRSNLKRRDTFLYLFSDQASVPYLTSLPKFYYAVILQFSTFSVRFNLENTVGGYGRQPQLELFTAAKNSELQEAFLHAFEEALNITLRLLPQKFIKVNANHCFILSETRIISNDEKYIGKNPALLERLQNRVQLKLLIITLLEAILHPHPGEITDKDQLVKGMWIIDLSR